MSAAEKEAARKADEAVLTSEARQLWQSIGEKARPSEILHQERGQEFVELPKDAQPVAEDLTRRDFFKWVGGASALFATACQQRPTRHLVPYVHKPEGWTYGVPVWFSSVSSNGLGVLVKTREGRPIKLEGNPDHALNQGGLDAATQAEILNLYNPERLQHPTEVSSSKKLSWDEANSRMMQALQAARPGAVRVLTSPVQSPSLQSALDIFSNKYSAKHESFSSVSYSTIARAHEIVYGQRRIPYLNLENADVVVSVDADFLGTWLRPVDFTKQFSKRRRIHEGETNVNRLFSFESNFSVTGTAADTRVGIKPSQQLKVLLTLISELSTQLRFDSELRATASSYSAEKLAKELSIDASSIKTVASALLAARGRSLVIGGVDGPSALEVQLACIALNEALGNYGSTLTAESIQMAASSPVAFDQLIADAQAGEVDVLVLQDINPVYSRPGVNWKEVFGKIKLVVSVGYELNETARLSHLAFGESHFLETWGDNESVTGHYAIQQPTIMPLFETKSFGEMLLSWSQFAQVDYRLFVQDLWKKRASSGNFEAWWDEKLRYGFWSSNASTRRQEAKWTGAGAMLQTVSANESADAIELVAYKSIALGDGSHANNAWLQELPDPISKVTWNNYVSLSPVLAEKLGVKANDKIRIQSGDRSLELSAFIQPGLHPQVAGVALGYGRNSAGSVGSGVGQNAFVFVGRSGTGDWQNSGLNVQLTKTGSRYELASTQVHFQLHGRDFDILQKTTLGEFLKDDKAAKAGKEIHNFSIYGEKEHVYPGHKWGMAIDLNKCTGCQACVVACYSENNIAVVGEDQVRKGRHLAWLRLDLYYEGEAANPEANFEPMLCQQCDHAPCETVCPVLATVHSSDGLNDMVYNRCVGTRYCANNCPYKVRRFNYFYYSDKLADKIEVSDESPLSLMLNPDVTVRSRGVMEKCTFCVQRIRKTTSEYSTQKLGELPNGAIKTACQQSCPADAIEFGDLNNPNHKVTQIAQKAQAFKVLEVLNTRPSISYLPRVRNKG